MNFFEFYVVPAFGNKSVMTTRLRTHTEKSLIDSYLLSRRPAAYMLYCRLLNWSVITRIPDFGLLQDWFFQIKQGCLLPQIPTLQEYLHPFNMAQPTQHNIHIVEEHIVLIVEWNVEIISKSHCTEDLS